MADKKEIIIDGVDVSGCCQYMPRYMEDYDIDTLDYCRYHFKPCKDVDVKYCYFKQLKRKEQECEELKKANDGILTTIRILAKNNIKLREILAEMKDIAEANIRIADLEGLNGVYRRGLAKQILQKISEI